MDWNLHVEAGNPEHRNGTRCVFQLPIGFRWNRIRGFRLPRQGHRRDLSGGCLGSQHSQFFRPVEFLYGFLSDQVPAISPEKEDGDQQQSAKPKA
ncbi:MAG: hypothetical protein IPK97_20780 [Ahniella sp.]|nr:hypothetical protein [Ahniella sp.]